MHLKEWEKVAEGLEDERRRLAEKLRTKKAMRELRRSQLNSFFDAWEQEIQRCRRNYTIDLDNDDLMFEQDFDIIQERIESIETQIYKTKFEKDPSK